MIVLIGNVQGQSALYDESYSYTVFIDNFSGTGLVRTVWKAENSYMRELGLLKDTVATLRVEDGNLELTMISCPNCSAGSYQGNYAGAEVISFDSIQYGVFECRAKFAHQTASWPAFWIIGGDGIPCAQGGIGNEIDIAELKCDDSNLTIDHVIHKYYAPSQCDGEEKDFQSYNGMNFDDNFHLFKCVWSPEKINYYVDNVFSSQVLNTGQDWYPSRFLHVRLSQQVVNPESSPVVPQTTYFDYVRVKQFFTPQITLSTEVVCTTGTATMNATPTPTSINWQLTPSSLFSGITTGTGATANITRASGANGKGKITYTFTVGDSGETFTFEKEILVGTQVSGTISVQMDAPINRFTASIDDVPTATSYNWYLNGVLNNTYHGTSAILNRVSPYCGGTYNVDVEAYNPCGWSAKRHLTVIEPSCQYGMIISPNPTDSESDIEIYSESEVSIDPDIEWQLEVFDQMQGLKDKKPKIKGTHTKISTSGWKDGVYYIQAIVGNEKISWKLAVKH